MDSYWLAVVYSVAPTIVLAGAFWWIMRSIMRMDRTERRVYNRIEAEERAKRGLPFRHSLPDVAVEDSAVENPVVPQAKRTLGARQDRHHQK